jgi:hypothetical protein
VGLVFLSFWIGSMGFVVVIALLLSFPGYQIGVEGGVTCAPAAYFHALSFAKSFLTMSYVE